MEISIALVVGLAMALTEWVKTKAGLADTVAEWVALGLSFLVGAFYQYTISLPKTFDQWFPVLFVGLLVSLTANGTYKLLFAKKA